MAKTSVVANEITMTSNGYIPCEEEKISIPGSAKIESPLTPVGHIPLITPNEPTSRWYLFHQNANGDSPLDPNAGLESRSNSDERSDGCQAVIIDINDMRKMKLH